MYQHADLCGSGYSWQTIKNQLYPEKCGGTIPLPFRSQVGFLEDRVFKKLGRLVDKKSVRQAGLRVGNCKENQ